MVSAKLCALHYIMLILSSKLFITSTVHYLNTSFKNDMFPNK